MDVTEAIETRIEVREYADEPIADETVEVILDAGRLAPSGSNRQHWRFILVDDDGDLDRVAELSPSGSWIAGAAFAVVILTDPTYPPHGIDAGRTLTHMQFAAWEHGVGSCIYTVDNPDLDDFLGVPGEFEVTAVVGFGKPTREIIGRKSRRPLTELAYHGRFGEPLDLR